MKILLLLALATVSALGGTYSLEISPTSEAAFIELPIPAGTTVKTASHGGSFDPNRGTIKWGPLLPAPPSVSFTLENEPNSFTLTPNTEPATVNVTASGPTQVDSDLDGLPDEYEALFQLDDSSLDHDNDGLSTLAEFLLGTHPRDSSDGLKTLSLTRTTDTLTWTVSPQLPSFVTIEAAIAPSATNWITLSSSLQQNGSSTTITTPINASNTRRFFRLRFRP